MDMIIHDIKVALRNLMKYKLQTLISVLSIAIGIVTLSFTHSILENFRLTPIHDEPYYDRAYLMMIKLPGSDEYKNYTDDMVLALKAGGGLKNAEKTVFSNYFRVNIPVEFHLADSTVRKGEVAGYAIDPGYPDYAGVRSSLTGKKIKKLKAGEAILSEDYAKAIFQDKNPIGAVQTLTSDAQPIPLTVVDVFRSLPITTRLMSNRALYFSLSDSVERLGRHFNFSSFTAEVVLKEGRTKEQLLKEAEQRLKPWNAKVEIQKVSERTDDGVLITIRFIIYLIGCLILVAAVIGFLRMQLQLVWLRSREISLRMVNGASVSSLFMLLMVEIAIVLALSVLMAIVLGILLKDFFYARLGNFLDEFGASVGNLWAFSLEVGVGLLVVCAVAVCVVLYRMAKSRRGLMVHMRGKRNHLFRSVMLGLQTMICFVFVCSSLVLVNAGEKIKNTYLIPENDEYLRQCLYLQFEHGVDMDRLHDEISRLPDLDRMVVNSPGYYDAKELAESPEAQEILPNGTYIMTYWTDDTVLLDVLGVDVKWLDKEAQWGDCMLMQKDMYEQLRKVGVLANNSLTLCGLNGEYTTLPIAGVFSGIPYEQERNSVVAITRAINGATHHDWMLLPRPGRGKSLERSLRETIGRVAPEAISKVVFNYREKVNPTPGLVETAVRGGWILGCVSLVICIMGIFSTIALDTRARRKEVAIRKVNGAKSSDIYRMFGKVYAWLIALSLIVAVPVSVMFGRMVDTLLQEIDTGISASFIWPIVIGCFIVIILILAIVALQVRRVMLQDPSRIIAKE